MITPELARLADASHSFQIDDLGKLLPAECAIIHDALCEAGYPHCAAYHFAEGAACRSRGCVVLEAVKAGRSNDLDSWEKVSFVYNQKKRGATC